MDKQRQAAKHPFNAKKNFFEDRTVNKSGKPAQRHSEEATMKRKRAPNSGKNHTNNEMEQSLPPRAEYRQQAQASYKTKGEGNAQRIIVDTKASKGRKTRYVTIEKLVNFYPASPESIPWSHEQRDRLFRSLFVCEKEVQTAVDE